MLRSLRFAMGLFLILSQLALGHPMDEWFVSIEVTESGALRGVFRVPADQVAGLQQTPIVFEADGVPLDPQWSESGADEDGRMKLELSAKRGGEFSELVVRIPQGLLDENQSLVGFLRLGEQEPTTLLIEPGGTARFSTQLNSSDSPSVGGFFKLGLTHILEGYDHLLFLFCLLIAGGTFRHILVVVTAFTLGHSLTLAASVLGYISLPSQLTETVIALSIVIAALMNIPWLQQSEGAQDNGSIKSRGILAGTFGLIHGLGFAGILKEIGVQGSGVAAPLLGFNLGVEAGQIALVLAFFPVLMAINKSNKRVAFLTACSYLAAFIGTYWVAERLGLFG
jgi:HupE / UreJ protein